jgi:hypothetical protein
VALGRSREADWPGIREKAYQFVLWLVPTVKKFPRAQKFLLGDRIQSAALDVLMGLVEATYSRNRTPVLRVVNLKLETLRLLFRLATDLRLLPIICICRRDGAGLSWRCLGSRSVP